MLSLWRSTVGFMLTHPWPRGDWESVRTSIFHAGFFRGYINSRRLANLLKCSLRKIEPKRGEVEPRIACWFAENGCWVGRCIALAWSSFFLLGPSEGGCVLRTLKSNPFKIRRRPSVKVNFPWVSKRRLHARFA